MRLTVIAGKNSHLEQDALHAIEQDDKDSFKKIMTDLVGMENSREDLAKSCKRRLTNPELISLLLRPFLSLDMEAAEACACGDEARFDYLCKAINCIRHWERDIEIGEMLDEDGERIRDIISRVADRVIHPDLKQKFLQCLEKTIQERDLDLVDPLFAVAYWLEKNIDHMHSPRECPAGTMKVINGDVSAFIREVINTVEGGNKERCNSIASRIRKKAGLKVVGGSSDKKEPSLSERLGGCYYRKWLEAMADDSGWD